MDVDIQLLSIGSSVRYMNYFIENRNKTSYAVAFCVNYWDSELLNIPGVPNRGHKDESNFFFYSLIHNTTLITESLNENYTESKMNDPNLLRIKQSLDNGIISYLAMKNEMENVPEIETTSSHYPLPVDRQVDGVNTTALMGSYWFNLPGVFTFLAIVILVMQEKELKLRQGLNVVGVTHSLYWVHWIITALFLSFMSSFVQMISGIIFKLQFFYNTNFIILFSMFFLYNIGMGFGGFTLGTLIPTRNLAFSIGYSIIAISLMIQFVFSFDQIVQVVLFPKGTGFYSQSTLNFIIFNRTTLYLLYPPFTYAMLFMQIMRISTTHFNSNYQAFIEGRYFTWPDLLYEEHDFNVVMVEYHVSSALSSFGYLLFNLVFYMILTWYFDHVIAVNRGIKYSKLFFLKKKYWSKICKRTIKSDQYVRHSSDEEISGIELEEDEFVNDYAIEINGICKTYKYGVCKRDGRRICHAVKPTHLKIFENELFGILGHNGAGKSTLINMLIGILPPTNNTAKMLGYDILSEIELARQYIGVVPQFDILWEDLTVNQNMQIFGVLKDVDPQSTIKNKLESVDLSDGGSLFVKQLSGGMRRRLSLAISLIGSPKIIFMDEPTSGMDPVIRKQVWKVIRDIKKTSTIVLTTHSMEEADVLSDRIGIMVDGKFKAVDTSLGLKNKYSRGYKLNITGSKDNTDKICSLISEIIPDINVLSEKGGSLIFTISTETLRDIISDNSKSEFLTLIQKDRKEIIYKNKDIEELSNMIINFGISQSTLEEVFTIVNK